VYYLVIQLITGSVTRLARRVPLVEQELPALPEHLSSPLVFNGIRVTLVLFFLLTIVLSVLRYTDSDYSFGIFKLFLYVDNMQKEIYKN